MIKSTKFKICILGDGGVGKTSYVVKLRINKFYQMYVPTLGVEVHPLIFNTNVGEIIVNAWDLSGQEKYSGDQKSYLKGGDGAIVMFDVTNPTSLKNVSLWEEKLENSPINTSNVIKVGTKVDLPMNDEVKDHKEYYPIISKSGEGCIEAMEGLLSKLMKERVVILR